MRRQPDLPHDSLERFIPRTASFRE